MTTAALHTTASETPKARNIMPNNKTITARLYQVLAASTLCLPCTYLLTQPVNAQAKAPGVVVSSTATVPTNTPTTATTSTPKAAPALPVQGTFQTPVSEERFSRTVAPGIELTTITRSGGNGPLQIFATRVNPHPENSDVRWKLNVAPAEYSALKAATVTAMSKKTNAVVAINGGYFAFGGAALGAVKLDGEWIRLPLKNRTAMGIDNNGRVFIGTLRASTKVVFGASMPAAGRANQKGFNSVSVGNLNGYAPEDGTSVVTSRFGKTYKLGADEMAFEIENSVVRAKLESGVVNISDQGWTLVARGAMRVLLSRFTVGQTASLQISAPANWNKFPTILGAGPRLLRAGKVETTEVAEEFRPDVLARGPRSAFGVDTQGQLWFVAVDGRDAEYSVGLNLGELAAEMKKLGAIEAICLDGGGSTAMTVNGILVNRPSDGSERRVANALVVTGDEIAAP